MGCHVKIILKAGFILTAAFGFEFALLIVMEILVYSPRETLLSIYTETYIYVFFFF